MKNLVGNQSCIAIVNDISLRYRRRYNDDREKVKRHA